MKNTVRFRHVPVDLAVELSGVPLFMETNVQTIHAANPSWASTLTCAMPRQCTRRFLRE